MVKTVREKLLENRIARLERKLHCTNESTGTYANKLIEACEDGMLDWETLARECVAENSESDNGYVCAILDLDYDDEEEAYEASKHCTRRY